MVHNEKIFIWGTGKYANYLVSTLMELDQYFGLIGESVMSTIEGFVDSYRLAENDTFYGKPILTPEEFFYCTSTKCVVAVLDNTDIVYRLNEEKIEWLDYLKYIEMVKAILLDKHDLLFDKASTCTNLRMKNNIIISQELRKWKKVVDRDAVHRIVEQYSTEDFIAASSWYFGDNIELLSNYFSCETNVLKPIEKVGIVADRLYGGGIERVLELLIPIFISGGLKVVLITDEVSDKDIQIPTAVEKHIMNNKINSNCYERISELGQCIKNYDIDVMSFHFGYNRISTFYEIAYAKMNNVPTVLEIHSGFMPILKLKKSIAVQFPAMYKIADRVVTLSNTDKLFWKSLESKAVYIPNPMSKHIRPIRHGNTNTVAWIGRIVDQPKRVCDVVPIMKKVVESIPDARCIIVGHKDKKYDYEKMKRQIRQTGMDSSIEVVDYTLDIQQIYERADVVLMTSSNESYSNVIQESKQYGIPLVMYDLPWLELVKDKKGYISVPQRDIDSAAEAIIRILSDKELKERLSYEAVDSIKPFAECDIFDRWNSLFSEIYQGKYDENLIPEVTYIEQQLLGDLFSVEKD